MPKYTLKNGEFSSGTYLQVTGELACDCGKKLTVQMQWPEGLTVNGEINVINQKCPQCGDIENYRLLSK